MHWQKEESMKFIGYIIKPWVIAARKNLGLPGNQIALHVWGVFKGQYTDKVNALLEELSIKVAEVLANTTHFFQLLHLTVNGCAKHFMRKKFVTWYSEDVRKKIDKGYPPKI